MDYKNVNDYEMLYLIGEKDERAEKILYAKYKNLIMKVAPKYLSFASSRGAELDDLVQEGFLGLYSAIKNYRPENQVLFYTFALVCIERQLSTYCKRLSSMRQEVLNHSYSLDIQFDDVRDPFAECIASSEDGPYENLLFSDYVLQILDFKNNLPKDIALVFELRLNGFRYQEISTLLDIPKRKVDSALSHIRTKLKNSHVKKYLIEV